MVIDEELNSKNDILEHHGIEGQKWGHRNGPPYPLDPNKDYSRSELKAMKKESRTDFRKEYRKFKKTKKRMIAENEERKKVENEERIEEEAKKRAIASGNISEIDKYKEKMTTQELNEAMNRVRAFQTFESLKINDVKAVSDRINEKVKRISAENSLVEAKLNKKYSPGKGEYALKKVARISDSIGTIATNANKIGIAVNTWKKIGKDQDEGKNEGKKKKKNSKEKSSDETDNPAISVSDLLSSYGQISVPKKAIKRLDKSRKKFKNEWDVSTERIKQIYKDQHKR